MKTPDKNPDLWQPCSPGLIKKSLAEASLGAAAAGTAAALGRRELITALGGGTVVLALGGLASWSLLGKKNVRESKTSVFPSEIACVDVIGHLQAYSANQLGDQALQCTIHLHLKHCASCRAKYQHIISSNPQDSPKSEA